jgi:hypothetical protein
MSKKGIKRRVYSPEFKDGTAGLLVIENAVSIICL